ncbi:helix-turn-helix domain-containing protein [Flavobacterium sp.]|uniref:helix-turn-helix domain-containing protein n=1 Tax=Flavobacterium sp. TaxID=239 RepID=UPI00403353ED
MATLREEDEILRDKIRLRLIELREIHEQNKSALAKNIEVDRQNLQAWEKPNTNRGMTIYSINRVCASLGITIKDFFDSPHFK